jgi:hypothetical protein
MIEDANVYELVHERMGHRTGASFLQLQGFQGGLENEEAVDQIGVLAGATGCFSQSGLKAPVTAKSCTSWCIREQSQREIIDRSIAPSRASEWR